MWTVNEKQKLCVGLCVGARANLKNQQTQKNRTEENCNKPHQQNFESYLIIFSQSLSFFSTLYSLCLSLCVPQTSFNLLPHFHCLLLLYSFSSIFAWNFNFHSFYGCFFSISFPIFTLAIFVHKIKIEEIKCALSSR